MNLRVLDKIEYTTVDGPGFRTSIYVAGCRHHCEGCHNPQSWSENGGELLSVEMLAIDLLADPFVNVTLTGGDPMFQAEACLELCRLIKEGSDKTVWCYTGFTWEEIHEHGSAQMIALSEAVDVLVDGRFVKQLRDTDLLFRGSSNQRLVDVHKTLSSGVLTLWSRE